MAIAKFTKAIADGETVTLFGDGSSARDYTYIDDIIDGVMCQSSRSKATEFLTWATRRQRDYPTWST